MSKPFDVREQLAAFTGWAPLFPLPNVVHFPHLLLPLHIFEPRYRQMVGDSMEGSRPSQWPCSSPALSPPKARRRSMTPFAWAASRPSKPRPTVGIIWWCRVSRARIVRESASDKLYRIAELTLHPDPETVASESAAAAQRRRLIGEFRKLYPRHDLDRVLRRAIEEAVRWESCAMCWRTPCRSGAGCSGSSDRARHQSPLWTGAPAHPRQAAAADEARPDNMAP